MGWNKGMVRNGGSKNPRKNESSILALLRTTLELVLQQIACKESRFLLGI